MIISETKLDNSFPTNQFIIKGFSTPFRRDRNAHGGGIMIFVREDIPCKMLKAKYIDQSIEAIFFELNLRKEKWLVMGGYNPKKEHTTHFLYEISKEMDFHLNTYENLLLTGDFNAIKSDPSLKEFCALYSLKNLITEPTCSKNPINCNVL